MTDTTPSPDPGDTGSVLRRAESIWGSVDDLFDRFDARQWAEPHGEHWVFADVPYHLGYFDREMIADHIGNDTDPEGPAVFRTIGDVDSWNDRHFDARRDPSVDGALDRMREGRAAVLDAVASAGDDTTAFLPLPGIGATTIDGALATLVMHTWNHFVEARIRSGIDVRADPEVTSLAIRSNLGFMPVGLNRRAATSTDLSICFEVRGIGAFGVEVSDGDCQVTSERPARPQLTLRFPDEGAFASVFNGIGNPMLMTMNGKLRVKGLSRLPTFARLFPPPTPDTVLGPAGTFSLVG